MRVKVIGRIDRPFIPHNSGYYIYSYINKLIARVDPSLPFYLHTPQIPRIHSNSLLLSNPKEILPEGIETLSTESYFYISSISKKLIDLVLKNIDNTFRIGSVEFLVDDIKIEKTKIDNNDNYIITTITPIVIKNKGEFLYFNEKFKEILDAYMKMVRDIYGGEYEEIKIINSNFTNAYIKKMKVPAYYMTIKIKANKKFVKNLVDIGVGHKQSFGYGTIKIVQ